MSEEVAIPTGSEGVTGFWGESAAMVPHDNTFEWPEHLEAEVREAWREAEAGHNVRYTNFWSDEARLSMKHVTEIVAHDVRSNRGTWQPGERIGTEVDLRLLVKVGEWHYAFIAAENDNTGWGCHGDHARIRYGTYEEVTQFGMGDEDRRRLGIELTR
jgi:hypothetical protein